MSVQEGGGRARITGTVKWFNEQKGFGFIGRDGGAKDIFLHQGELKKSGIVDPVDQGDVLRFDIDEAPRGPKAVNIERVVGE